MQCISENPYTVTEKAIADKSPNFTDKLCFVLAIQAQTLVLSFFIFETYLNSQGGCLSAYSRAKHRMEVDEQKIKLRETD